MKWLKWLIVMCSVAETLQTETLTTQGTLRGEAHEGYISYQGIPYASVNDTARFKGAGLAPRWSGIRESQQTRCSVSSRVEDCLQLDVHVPTAGPPWPVLVWVKGSGGQYNPGRLVREGIVVVVVSHRFGPMGFLCLEDEKIPGNAGVKDVLLALRWVRDNISAFKGNPHKVVVGGQGFAAAIVEVLLLSPNAQDLLHGAIMQSGSSLSPWAFNFDARERALLLAQSLDDSEDEILTLVKASIDVLSAKSHVINVPYIPFGICIEKSFKNEERLLPEPPHRLLSNKFSRKVPLIIGYNSDEAYIFLSLLRQKKIRQRIRSDLTILIPEELKFLNRAELRSVVEKIQDLYFKNLTLAALLAYHRDAYFVNHILRSTRFHAASHQPVYLYRFSYAGKPGVYSDHQVKKSGAAHSDELAYLFPENYQDMEGNEGLVQQNLIRLWTNFVKYLVPTPTTESLRWESVEESFSRLLDISATLAMQDVPRTAGGVWDDIYNRFYYERNAL